MALALLATLRTAGAGSAALVLVAPSAAASVTVTISDSTADFGTNLAPGGASPNSPDVVVGFQDGPGTPGSYYVWKGATGAGVTITVDSSKAWSGTLQASENSGTSSSMTIAGGVLGWVETTAPSSYAACQAAAVFRSSAQTWKSNVAKGTRSYVQFYCLRINWNDDPGTFGSNVTYTVTQG